MLRAYIGSKTAISLQRGPVDPKFPVEGVAPTNHSTPETRLNDFSYIRKTWTDIVFSERELMFMFAICRRPSVCRLSVTFVQPTQPIEIFSNVSAPFNTLVTWRHPGKILRRSSQRNPSVGGLNQRVVEKCSDFGPFRGYISETVQERR